MKYNYNRSLKIVVPKDIRLSVYKDAIKIFERNEPAFGMNSKGLCLLLPCILYDLDHYLKNKKGGEIWSWWETEKAFPEIEPYINELNGTIGNEEKNALRLSILKKIVKDFVS